MQTRRAYIVLCVLGAVLPYSQFVPWVLDNGFDLTVLFQQLFSTQMGAFFALDVIVSALTLLLFMLVDGHRNSVRHRWAAVAGTLAIGVSFGLPLYLLLREVQSESAA